MYFYEVAPASRQYHGSTPLTYNSEQWLTAGQVVVVKIRSKSAMAFIIQETAKPDFKTTEINEALDIYISSQQIKLFNWLLDYYPAPLGVIASLFLPFNKPENYIPKDKTLQKEKKNSAQRNLPLLTDEQTSVVKQINSSKQKNHIAARRYGKRKNPGLHRTGPASCRTGQIGSNSCT